MKTLIYQKIARMLPRKLLYYCVIQAWCIATTEKWVNKSPDEVSWDMVCTYLNGK